MRRVIFGGTFDPIHAGHVEVAEAAGRLLGADRVSFVPAYGPPHKPEGAHASASDRLAMVHAAVAGNDLLDVLDEETRREGISYTIDTVERLLAGPCRGDVLMLLVGQDALELLPQWHRVRELAALVPFAVLRRPDAASPDWPALTHALGEEAVSGLRARLLATPLSPISSTEVRDRIARGQSVRCWVPDPVADYIEEHRLYGMPQGA